MESEERCDNGGKLQHAVCLPFPAQGHVNPMLKLAILLHHRGFHITFVNTEYNHRRLLRARSAAHHSLHGLPGFQFKTIPDGLSSPEDVDKEANCTQDVPSLCDSTSKHCLPPFLRLLSDLNSSPHAPPVTCVVSDNIMSFGLVAAEEIGVAGVSFRSTTACSFFCNALLQRFSQKGLIPLKDSNGGVLKTGDSDRVLADLDVPGFSSSIRLRDLPTYALISNEVNTFIMSFVSTETKRALTKASAIIFHTLDSLEHDTLESLSAMCPPIYPIAPLHLLIDQLPDHGSLKFLGANLWKEDLSCLQWLDSKAPSSVVYVNFGSVIVITQRQLMEFAWGLAKSKQNFLWVVRSDGVMGESSALPGEFYEETKGRGIVLSWCPQERVLKHRSTGAFLTHCGWNSMMESISSGVPMICWPFFADQHINCRLACAEWGVGVEIESEVDRDEVEKVVREVMMDGEKGEEMKVKARELKRKAEEAVGVGGSSHLILDQLIKNVISSAESA